MLVFEIFIISVVFFFLIFLHIYLHNKEKVDITEVMLEVSLGWFLRGDLNEEEYQAQRSKIFGSLTQRQRKMYNKRYGIDKKEVESDGV